MGQIGVIRLKTASGTKDVPVYDVADVSYSPLRVQTPSGVGAIRLADPSDATYPELRVQTQSGVKAVSAEIIIDNVEDNDISEYNGYTSYLSTTTSPTYNGSYAMEHSTDGSGQKPVASTSGLSAYPSAGNTIHFQFQPTDAQDVPHVVYGAQGTSFSGDNQVVPDEGGYGWWWRPETNDLNFRVDGSKVASWTPSGSNDTNSWMELVVDWGSGGTHTLTVYNSTGSQVFSKSYSSDTKYSSGGIGFGQDNSNGGSTSSYWDYFYYE